MSLTTIKYAVLVITCLLVLTSAAACVYNIGYGKARAEGNAAIAEIKQAYADENANRWAEYAAKERAARVRLQEEQVRADNLTARLLQVESTLAQERRNFSRRIADATRDTTYTFTPEFVRLYNEALYGPSASSGHTDKADSAGSLTHSARSTPPLNPRLLLEQSVTPADILAHARDYGAYCRGLSVRLHTWLDLSVGW